MEEQFNIFRNEVFCRRESNQHKANKLWGAIKNNIPEKERRAFSIEWSHYLLNEFDADMFGVEIKKIEKYFKK